MEKQVTFTATILMLLLDQLNNWTSINLGYMIALLWLIDVFFLFTWIVGYIQDRKDTKGSNTVEMERT